MISITSLAVLSAVPICTGAPLGLRLDDLLQWLTESQQSNQLETTSWLGSTELQTPTLTTVTTNSWNPTASEETTTTAIPTVQFSDASKISLIFILIFAAIALWGMIGFVGLKILHRYKKSSNTMDEEEMIEPDPDRFYPCHFVLPELVQESNKHQGFVTLNDSGQIVDVKRWTFEQLDEYFKGKCSLKLEREVP